MYFLHMLRAVTLLFDEELNELIIAACVSLYSFLYVCIRPGPQW